MKEKYLLDTNAYFNFLKDMKEDTNGNIWSFLYQGECYISKLTLIEIISVIGKYARGETGGRRKCSCTVSESGEKCSNYIYYQGRTKWNHRLVKAWLKYAKDIENGESDVLHINILPLNDEVLEEAGQFIHHALVHKFGSQDAIIASTAKKYTSGEKKMIVVTSDKGLKAGMQKSGISYFDPYAHK